MQPVFPFGHVIKASVMSYGFHAWDLSFEFTGVVSPQPGKQVTKVSAAQTCSSKHKAEGLAVFGPVRDPQRKDVPAHRVPCEDSMQTVSG